MTFGLAYCEAVGAFTQNYYVPLCILVDDSCRPSDFGWPSRHRSFDLRFRRLTYINPPVR
jgi:hypothetical protein